MKRVAYSVLGGATNLLRTQKKRKWRWYIFFLGYYYRFIKNIFDYILIIEKKPYFLWKSRLVSAACLCIKLAFLLDILYTLKRLYVCFIRIKIYLISVKFKSYFCRKLNDEDIDDSSSREKNPILYADVVDRDNNNNS